MIEPTKPQEEPEISQEEFDIPPDKFDNTLEDLEISSEEFDISLEELENASEKLEYPQEEPAKSKAAQAPKPFVVPPPSLPPDLAASSEQPNMNGYYKAPAGSPRFNPYSAPSAAPSADPPVCPLPPPPPSVRARPREIIALLVSVILCDITLYSGGGFAGLGLFFLAAPALLFLGCHERNPNRYTAILFGMLGILGIHMFWLGSAQHAWMGFALLLAYATTLLGLKPFPLATLFFSFVNVMRGIGNLIAYARASRKSQGGLQGKALLALVVPALALLVFGGIFILANPDVREFIGDKISALLKNLSSLCPTMEQAMFWALVLWVTAGLLRQRLEEPFVQYFKTAREEIALVHLSPGPCYLYQTARNTLLAVVALFGAYLIFEFYHLWFRTFPKGFYYSGYAHQGAGWLTLALALSTATLGFLFRGALLADPGIARLKRITWAWAVENYILAICIFHRMMIYVNYNGMSYMRVVALYGIIVVAAGFGLVVWKVARGKNFLWLTRRHLWALGMAMFLLMMTPVDYIATRHNVNAILSGDLAPAVQISCHPIGPDGVGQLFPLLKSANPDIREGIKAILAGAEANLAAEAAMSKSKGWSYYQYAQSRALNNLAVHSSEWREYQDAFHRDAALQNFNTYTHQWYD